MPEGDTAHRVALVLGRELTGRTLDRVSLRDRGDVPALAGRRVEGVEARGKHVLVHLEGGWSLRVHLGMKGRWWRRDVREALPPAPTALLVAGDTAYACVGAYGAEAAPTRALRTHPVLGRLGPDLLSEPPPIEEVVGRARSPAHAGRQIGDLLLDQRVASGIGNVYKSEALFECRIHPRAAVGALSDEALAGLFETAARLLRLGLLIRGKRPGAVRRRATPTSRRLWVYGRAGKPCLDCGTPVERFLQGDHGRSTYFCPGCQGEGAPPLSA